VINKCLVSLLNDKMDPSEDTGEPDEQVLFELDLMKIEDLQLMAWQNELSTEGDRVSLISRIKDSFGFGRNQSFVSNADTNIAAKSSSSTPSSAPTMSNSAKVLPRFDEDWSTLEIPDEDEAVGLDFPREMSRQNLEAGEASGKV
jgi:hypothetical protein